MRLLNTHQLCWWVSVRRASLNIIQLILIILMTYTKGAQVKLECKEMLIPAKIVDVRQIFGRDEYRLALLSDEKVVSKWITEKDIYHEEQA